MTTIEDIAKAKAEAEAKASADEFRQLDAVASKYWFTADSAESFRRRLCGASPEALNSKDQNGWNILTYVLHSLCGATEEIKTLQILLGPDVAMEDHSRLRLDATVFTLEDTSGRVLRIEPAWFASQHPQLVRKRFARDILESRANHKIRGAVLKASFKSHIAIAELLLRRACERIQTYPTRLILALTDACTDYLPTRDIYLMISGYLCY